MPINTSKRRIVVEKDLHSLSRQVADKIRALVCGTSGTVSLAVSGGKTPLFLYNILSEYDIPWERVHIFWVDERFVPFNHPDSNYGAAERVLPSSIPRANLHPIQFIHNAPELASERYEEELLSYFGDGRVAFDLIILGIGEDGHTASLFPGSSILEEKKRLAAVCRDAHPVRISLTFPVLNNAKNTFFLVSGTNKRSVLLRILGKSKEIMPAKMLKPKAATWYVTADAWKKVGQ